MPRVKSVCITNLYGRYNLQYEFFPDINVLYGKNGSGKTTLLHILANALNGELYKFAFLWFDSIDIELDNEISIAIKQKREPIQLERHHKVSTRVYVNNELLEEVRSLERREDYLRDVDIIDTNFHIVKKYPPFITSAYFPSFRAMIEAWSAITFSYKNYISGQELKQIWDHELFNDENALITWNDFLDKVSATDRKAFSDEREYFAENLLGKFIPELNYHSISEIQERIVQEINDQIIESDSIDEIIQEITVYLNAVNHFLEGKKLKLVLKESRQMNLYNKILYDTDLPLRVKFDDTDDYDGLQVLSSGERQLVTMLYASSRISQKQLILVDEPEISFHIDWQEDLLEAMSKQVGGNCQIIVCTHSPMIGVQHEDRMAEVRLMPVVN